MTNKQLKTISALPQFNYNLTKTYQIVNGNTYNSAHVAVNRLLKNAEFKKALLVSLESLETKTISAGRLYLKLLDAEV